MSKIINNYDCWLKRIETWLKKIGELVKENRECVNGIFARPL